MPKLIIDSEKMLADILTGRDNYNANDFDEIIVATTTGAERGMHDLRAAGVAPEKLSWREDGRDRDFRWRDERWADDLPETDEGKYLACGIDGLGKRVNWRLPELVLVAGPYASGKSLFAQLLAQDFVNRNDQWASLTCWEDQLDEIRDGLVRYRNSTRVPDWRRADFLKRFRMTLVKDETDREISKHLERIEYEAKRFGIKFFVLDPWNEFEHKRSPKQTEGEYVINVMTDCSKLCNKLGIIILLTTHVSAEYVSHGEGFKPFRIAHAFGSSQFGNKVHRGFCVVRTRKWNALSHMIVRQDKVKLESIIALDSEDKPFIKKPRMGYPDTMAFLYDPTSNSIHHDGEASKKAKEEWR